MYSSIGLLLYMDLTLKMIYIFVNILLSNIQVIWPQIDMSRLDVNITKKRDTKNNLLVYTKLVNSELNKAVNNSTIVPSSYLKMMFVPFIQVLWFNLKIQIVNRLIMVWAYSWRHWQPAWYVQFLHVNIIIQVQVYVNGYTV